ncbi:MAG: hypothetical protein DPW21_11835 [Anaerolineae bacterium]|nr:CPBP family intramembrane metalloprotease [Chloroflexi bacterium CFX1]MCQ3947368.1 hypothetical protein [Anaerolineae bacterium]
MKNRYSTLLLLILAILAIFAIRALLAERIAMPRTFEVFDTLTVVGALVVVLKDRRYLRRGDWLVALILGAVIGIGMLFATLFSPYPFLGLVKSAPGQALLRGLFTILATLGGLAIMRQGGPVQFSIANGDWRSAGRGALLGLTVGLPLAILNVFTLWLTQGQSFDWQHPLAALLDALQPAVVEEVIHRFALWGLLWLLLRRSLPEQAAWLAGLLAMLAHTYSHFDDLFLQSPLTALGMGAILAIFWGLPPLILARRRGLESAMAFHWLQDALRFLAGF